ncbi:hypothetical protein FRB90_006165 [Tulasnella sp. 427]|nr:hypothetical protein FRB90_006165 [Tulasnella sp. 427]
MSSKRPRKSASTASDASKDSLSSSPPTQLSPKAARRGSLTSTKSPTKQVSCTLPPTCNPPNPPTVLVSSKEFEKHYSLYHTHVCTAPESKRHATSAREGICGKVFPDARLLDLFSCFVSTCEHKFSTPKGRRLHLIDIHKYPKEYYFSITAKGVGEILHRWGQGASLLRKEWKPRPGQPGATEDGEASMDVEPVQTASPESSPASSPTATRQNSAAPGLGIPRGTDVKSSLASAPPASSTADKELDNLASNLSSLSLVPPSIRFGRGGKTGGFRGRGGYHGPPPSSRKSTEGEEAAGATKPLGAGKRPGRGKPVAFVVLEELLDVEEVVVEEAEVEDEDVADDVELLDVVEDVEVEEGVDDVELDVDEDEVEEGDGVVETEDVVDDVELLVVVVAEVEVEGVDDVELDVDEVEVEEGDDVVEGEDVVEDVEVLDVVVEVEVEEGVEDVELDVEVEELEDCVVEVLEEVGVVIELEVEDWVLDVLELLDDDVVLEVGVIEEVVLGKN